MKPSSLLPVVVAGLVLSGCSPPPEPPAPSGPFLDDRPITVPPPSSRVKVDGKEFILLVRLHMASVEVPIGKASGTEELWSYLDEESVAAVHGVALGLNGVRVGVGRANAWSDVVGVLQKMTGRKLKEGNMITVPGGTVPTELKKRQDVETIFTFYEDRTLTGSDYPPGDYLLTLSSTVSEDDPSKAVITGVPQIRTTRRDPHFTIEDGRATFVNRPTVFSFRPLTFQVTVPRKDFLVIGPGTEARRPNSVGHHFFVKDKDGLEFETVLVVVPEVFAAPLEPAEGGAGSPLMGGEGPPGAP